MGQKRLKQLALKLHSYPEKDRRWILDNLTKSEVTQINTVIGEIKEKNITADYQLIHESLNDLNGHETLETTDQSGIIGKLIKDIDKSDHEKVLKILQDEESWVLALLFEMHLWRWQDNLEQVLSPNKKMQIKQYQMKGVSGVKMEVKINVLTIISDLLKSDEIIMTTNNNHLNFMFDTSSLDDTSDSKIQNKHWWGGLWP